MIPDAVDQDQPVEGRWRQTGMTSSANLRFASPCPCGEKFKMKSRRVATRRVDRLETGFHHDLKAADARSY